MNPIPIIIIWVILFIVIIGYVVFRLFSDKDKGGNKNILYPLNSNPSDPMFPKSNSKLEWVGYIAIALSILGMVIFLVLDLNNIGNIDSLMIVYIVNALFLIGIICMIVSKFIIKK